MSGWRSCLQGLNEKLCVRVNELRGEGAGYEVIKRALLKAVGETTITYGHRIFQVDRGGSEGKDWR